MLFAHPRQAMNAAAIGPNYATLVWHHRHLAQLQATSTHISSLHEHVAARKMFESLKNWSGHGLSNRTGSAGPVLTAKDVLSNTWRPV